MALRHQREGNDVKLFIKDPHPARNFYNKIIPNISTLKQAKGWADLVVFMNNGLVDEWKECMTWGVPVYGGSEAGQKLEKDRPGAQELAKSMGLMVPQHVEVKTTQEARDFLQKNEGPFVMKFVGGTTDSDDVILGEYIDNKDLIRFCNFMDRSGKKWDAIDIDQFIDGIEMGCAAFSDGNKYAPGIEINFQGKRFASGEDGNGIGFLTGEMHTVIRYVDERNVFFQKTLGKLLPHLQKIGYRGEIDMGCIVDKFGRIWFIEFTPRTGYPDFVIRYELQVTPFSQLQHQIAMGDVKENKVLPGWAIGTVLVSPGFPDPKSSERRSVGLPIIGYDEYKENQDHCWLFEAKRTDEGLVIASGGYGYPMVVTGKGPTIESARRRAYWMLNRANPKRVYVPKAWYRDDAGVRVLNRKDEIIELGIMTPEEWDA